MFSLVRNSPRSSGTESATAATKEAEGTPAPAKRARSEPEVPPRIDPRPVSGSGTRAPRAALPEAPALKTQPYYPVGKGRSDVSYNCRVEVRDGLATCRHFASAYSTQALAGPDGTRDFLRACKDPESIRAFVQGQGGLMPIQHAFEKMTYAAPNKAKHLVSADRLGAYLTEVANHLDAGGGASDRACFLLLTEDHAMAVKVERKSKPDKGTYFAVSTCRATTFASKPHRRKHSAN